ncbi:MAG TPA: beta-glucosidase BglX [Terriglobales bacterium]|nr:beta-glucosidase BglX [Terriglobales bacterium]
MHNFSRFHGNVRRCCQLLLIITLLTAVAFSQSWSNDPKIESRINSLLKQMTLEEKIGQLNQYSAGSPTGPGTGRTNYEDMLQKGQIGSLFNVTGPRVNELQKIAVEKSRLKIPIIFGLDVIHGYRTTFPTPLGMSSTWDMSLIEKAARVAAIEASSDGIRWTFSPMVDIARDARWGRIVEGGGEDPFLGSAIARAYVRGYQGTSLADPTSIAACAKHYVGYGAAEGGRDYNTTEIPERLLRQVYLPPFHAAQQEGAATFMSAFNSLNEVPASANPFTLDQVLRKEWKFRGFVVSDWTSIGELIPHGLANDGATAARKAILAGVDMDMEANLYFSTLAEQVKAGKVPASVIDEAVRRILRIKFALGLFENPYTTKPPVVGAPLAKEHTDLARTVAEKSFVLLKNNGVLPLKAQQKVALIGPFADNAHDMLGSWRAQGESKDAVTLKTSLEEKLGPKVIFSKGTGILESPQDTEAIQAAVEATKQADVAVVALGEASNEMTGEAASRTEITLPGRQLELLKAVAGTGKPVVLLVFSGRPVILNWAAENVAAILETWHPGVQAGPAITRTLYGENNPSGKLTVSFPRAVGQVPMYYNHLNTGRPLGTVDDSVAPNAETPKFKSRYIDQRNSPLYPFGFGLSYTTFTYSPVSLSSTSFSAADLNGTKKLTVRAEVKNSGTVAGEETVQLYIAQTGTSVVRPVRELKGFQKLALSPGESKQVEFTLGQSELAFWNLDMKNVVEPAKVKVWVAGSSDQGTPVEFTIN